MKTPQISFDWDWDTKKKVATVRFDNREQVSEFFAVFQTSEVSNYFSFVCLPPGNPNDPEARGILAFLVPMGETGWVDRQFFDVLGVSLRDGMLAKWQAEGRVTMPSLEPAEGGEAVKSDGQDPLVFRPEPFRIDSSGWEVRVAGGEAFRWMRTVKIKTDASGDALEPLDGPFKGLQFFTHSAALRETARAGKRMPTMAEWHALIRELEPDVEFRSEWQDQAYLVRRLGLFWEAKEANPWLLIHSSDYSEKSGDPLGIALTVVRVQPSAEFDHRVFGLVFCHGE